MNYQTSSKMQNKSQKIIAYFATAISLVVTPWFNKESITVPKFILLAILSSYLVPNLFKETKILIKSKTIKFLLIIQILILAQLVLVVSFSSSPLEQLIYGRSGRLLGFITYFCLTILFIASIRYINIVKDVLILKIFSFVGSAVAIYGISQSFGIDFVRWDSRTNGVIGTLGNPNFVSALIAAATIPTLLVLHNKFKYRLFVLACVVIFSIFAIYRTQSIQGFIALFVAFSTYILVYSFFNLRKYFLLLLSFGLVFFSFLISGALGHGMLSSYLYKVSIQSRGDFWRSAYAMANDNPILGVGLDSFGDNYLKYRDQLAANHPFAEFTDSAHNFLLDYASQGGYPLLILNLITIFTVVAVFTRTLRKRGRFDKNLVVTFSGWLAFQSTFLISPMSTPLMVWSTIFAGAIIGTLLHEDDSLKTESHIRSGRQSYSLVELSRLVLVFLTTIAVFPVYHADTIFLDSLKSSNGNLGLKVIDMFPRSTAKYFTVGKLFWESGQNQYSLEVARKAIDFNNKSINAWGLILVNPLASYDERLYARNKILELDPFNKEVPNYQITSSS